MRCRSPHARFSSRLIAAAVVALVYVTGSHAWAQDDDLLKGLDEEEDAAPAKSKKGSGDPDAPVDDIGGSDADAPEIDRGGSPGLSTDDSDDAPSAGGANASAEPTAQQSEVVDRVKAVPRKPVLKELRLELSPLFAVSINDAYFTHLTLGGTVVFYPHDNFGIGLSGTYFLASLESDNQRVVRIGQTAVPAVFSPPTGGGTLDLYWNPIYGKISLANKLIVPFDIYAVVGAGFMVAGPNVRPSFKAGLGQRFFVNEWLAVRLELVDLVYNDTQVVNTQTHSDLQNFILFSIGASFFVPPSFEYSTL